MIAAFLAKKGATKIEEGARTIDEKQMYQAVRGRSYSAIDTDAAAINERRVTYDHLGREWVHNGLGELVS